MLDSEDYTHTVRLKMSGDASEVNGWCRRQSMLYKNSLDFSRDMVPDIVYYFAREQDATLFALRWSENVVDTVTL